MRNHPALIAVFASTLTLCACGGGGGSNGLAVQPLPPPPAPPPPTSPPPLPPGAIGLTKDGSFAVYAVQATGVFNSNWFPQGPVALDPDPDVQFSYSAADDRYTISVPGRAEGTLVASQGNGSWNGDTWTNISSTFSRVTQGSSGGPLQADYYVTLSYTPQSTYKHTGWGEWRATALQSNGLSNDNHGYFTYGVPTAAGDVPTTGSATYSGLLSGLTSNARDVYGDVTLSFDFGLGTLSGSMRPQVSDGWDLYSLGTYTFRNTVFGVGSRTFSGSFDIPGGSAGGSFAGQFTGPAAAELMAQWQAPYQDPVSQTSETMAGVWIGRH